MAYGQALKDHVLALYDEGEQTGVIAKRLRLSKSWCRRVKQRRHEPPRKMGGKAFKLNDASREALRGWVVPTLRPGMAVVMDNLAAHKVAAPGH